MRLAVLACLAAVVGLCGFAPAASAGTKVLIKARSYDITGATGAALVEAMDRNGPKHGFMTRAIADTAYTVNWDLAMSRTDGVCHLRKADGVLDLTYTYPRLASPASPALERRWKQFYAGVRAHEETHGRIAKRMMWATARAIQGLNRPDNWFCSGTRQEAKRRINAIYAEYEAKQIAFDAREHRDGGHVEHLVDALIKP
jgi:predicted secreted Zn-dependent protease